MYPDVGPLSRDKYARHVQFMDAGAEHNERLLLGGNRSGKTVCGSYELTAHLTGKYAPWWKGRRFLEPINAWAAGDTSKTVRDIIQLQLLGPPGNEEAQGTGMIPKDAILRTTTKMGLADAIENVFVRHISGGTSTLQLKSYDQGREAFQGSSLHVIWLDEEVDSEVYIECLLRTLTTNGIVFITATPLLGLTDLMLQFLPDMQPAPEITVQ